jgi:hypothetical protein
VALLQAGAVLFEGLGLDGDEATGANIVKVAPEAWLKQIAVNAGLEGGVVADKVHGLTAGEGLDAATGLLYSRTRQSSRADWPPGCHLAGSGRDQEGCEGAISPVEQLISGWPGATIIAVSAIAKTEEMTWSRSTVNRQRPSLD